MPRSRSIALAGAAAAALATATPAVASAGERQFLSPSGNIACILFSGGGSDGVRCDIQKRTFHQPKPKGCQFDWGNSVSLSNRGPGRVSCISDSVFGSWHHLAYGKSISLGGFRCSSATAGVTCTYGRHGFFLSRDTYRLF